MFKYFPQTPDDIKAMLKVAGVATLDDLFVDIPDTIRWRKDYQVPSAMSELEITAHMQSLANQNRQLVIFRGAGAYDHYTPTTVKSLTSRQEFLTSYTPYQPEIAQGTLHYIFEYQSMLCELTGLDVSNASMYDGATATAEALFMAYNATKSNRILVSDLVNPSLLNVLKTYALYRGLDLHLVKSQNGQIDRTHIQQLLAEGPASLVVQYPNYYGIVEDFSELSNLIHRHQGLMIMNTNPSLLAVLKTPAEQGVDIACGDAQSLGVPLSFGGPYIGFLTAKHELVRKMPGRICGMTKDVDGKRAFVLTLQAREQHIRRDKANTNICSNQSLMALSVAIYLSTLGKQGLIDVATQSIQATHYLMEKLVATKYFNLAFKAPFAGEVCLTSSLPLERLNDSLLQKGILGGLPVTLPGSKQMGLLLAVTEKRTLAEIDQLVNEIEVFAHEVL